MGVIDHTEFIPSRILPSGASTKFWRGGTKRAWRGIPARKPSRLAMEWQIPFGCTRPSFATTNTLKPLNIAFLDVKKAFDLVSHKSLILATKRMGVPSPMLVYLRELYGDTSISLWIGPDRSKPIGVSIGTSVSIVKDQAHWPTLGQRWPSDPGELTK